MKNTSQSAEYSCLLHPRPLTNCYYLMLLVELTPFGRRLVTLLSEVAEVNGVMGPSGGQGFHGTVNSVWAESQGLEHEMVMVMMKKWRRTGNPYRETNEGREGVCFYTCVSIFVGTV